MKEIQVVKKEKVPDANVAFIGKYPNGEPKEVPAFVHVTRNKIKIPEGTKHSEGFYSADASLLIASSHDFKAFVSKGDK